MTTKLSAYLVYSSLAFGALLFAERLLPPGQAQTMPSIKRINISVNEMVYDPISKKIYASVPSSAGTSGNSITVIDPVTATTGPSVFIGSEPNKLAVSDDGKYLYVGLDGARAVRRFNIQTLSPKIQFPLGNNPFGEPLLAADIAVMPGCSETVLVARSTSSVSGGGTIAIYDNGVQRGPANPTETFSGAIAFGTSPVTVFVFSGLELKRVSITNDGLRSLDSTSGLIPGSGEIKVDGNLVFTTTGRVVDPIAKSLLGTFGNFPPYTPVEPDTAQGKVFFLQVASDSPVGNQTYRVAAFNQHTYLSIGSIDVPNVSGVPQSLIRFGRDGIAFNTRPYPFPVPSGTPQVFLITAPNLIGIPAGTTIVSAASFRPGSSSAEAITTVFGAGLTAEIARAETLPLPTTLGGASVKVKDNAGMERAAPLFFVSPAQINFLVPPGSIPGPATVTVMGGDGAVSTGATHITTVSPAIFSANTDGAGVPAAIAVRVRADNSQEIEAVAERDRPIPKLIPRPIDLGPDLGASSDKVFLVLFGTGLRGRSGLERIVARMGCDEAMVSFAGAQGNLAGLDQVNLLIPRSQIGRGEVDVVLTVDGATTNTVKINIK
jgi:uncharacterized protein (TIGR03437 family)